MKEKRGKKNNKNKEHKKAIPQRQNYEHLLLENSIALQKVLTNLSIKLDGLSEQISKLLSLFEISAKSFSEKYSGKITSEDKDFIDKLNKLMEQNKLIAKGLALMDEKIKNKEQRDFQNPRPFPKI